jgi:hypothetical protein
LKKKIRRKRIRKTIIHIKKDQEVILEIDLEKEIKIQRNITKNTDLIKKVPLQNPTGVAVVIRGVILLVIKGKNIKKRKKSIKNTGENTQVHPLLGRLGILR